MKRTKSITLEDDIIEYIEALKKETGIGSFSGVVERVFLSIMLTNEYKINKLEILKEEVIEPREEIINTQEDSVIVEEIEPIVEKDNTVIESGRVRIGRGSDKLDKIDFGKNKKKDKKKADEKKR